MPSVNRTGRVSAIDYAAGTYEVTYFDRGKSVTMKVNAVSNGEYRMPNIGQIVSVSHNSNGTEAAVSMGTVWNQKNRPAEGYKGLYRKEFGSRQGQAYERYDENTGEYTQFANKRTGRKCGGDIRDEAKGKMGMTAGKGYEVNVAGGVEGKITGDVTLTINGVSITISSAGDVSVTSPTKIEFRAPVVNIEGDDGDVTVKGISLTQHTH